jgi:hypothetical protein
VSGAVDDAPDAVRGQRGALLLAGHPGLRILSSGEDEQGLVAKGAQTRGLLDCGAAAKVLVGDAATPGRCAARFPLWWPRS